MSVNPTIPPREHFRFMFKEQMRSRNVESFENGVDEQGQRMEAGAMDAFDYVWRRYGLDQLDIRPGRE